MSTEHAKRTDWAKLTNQQLIDVLVAIDRALECSVCRHYIRDTAATCTTGHGICTSCSTRLQVCPQCNTPLSAVKPTMLNYIIDLIPHRCRHSSNGCDKTILPSSKENHERNCGYRKSFCWVDDCDWIGITNGLLTHLKSNHSTSLYSANNPVVQWPVLEEDRIHNIPVYSFDSIIWGTACLDTHGLSISFQVWPQKVIPKLLAVVSLKHGDIEITETISVQDFEDVENLSETCETWKSEIYITRKVFKLLLFNGCLSHSLKIIEDVL